MCARISDAVVEALKELTPEYLSIRCGIDNVTRNFVDPWPTHKHEHYTPSAHYYPDTHTITNFGDGDDDTYNVFQLAGALEGIPESDFRGMVQAVADVVGYRLEDGDDTQPRSFAQRQPEPYQTPEEAGHCDVLRACQDAHDALYTKEGSVAREYLYGRGFDDLDMRKYGLGYVRRASDFMPEFKVWEPDSPGFVVVPFAAKGWDSVTYAMLRTIVNEGDEATCKEWRPKGFKSPLWREWMLTTSQPEVYVCEGLLDAMSLEKLKGVPTMALGGTKYAGRMAQVLYHTPCEKRPDRVIVCMDEDDAGRETADNMERDLDAIGVRHERLRPYPYGKKDANDLLQYLKGTAWEFDCTAMGQGLPPARTTRWMMTNG